MNKKSKVPKTHINPLVKQTWWVRYDQWLCKKFGCITYGQYYAALPQAHCSRCGKMTHHADKTICDPWVA